MNINNLVRPIYMFAVTDSVACAWSGTVTPNYSCIRPGLTLLAIANIVPQIHFIAESADLKHYYIGKIKIFASSEKHDGPVKGRKCSFCYR